MLTHMRWMYCTMQLSQSGACTSVVSLAAEMRMVRRTLVDSACPASIAISKMYSGAGTRPAPRVLRLFWRDEPCMEAVALRVLIWPLAAQWEANYSCAQSFLASPLVSLKNASATLNS